MTIEAIERDFKEKVCDKLRLASEGMNRYRVFTPFMFEDGDHLSIILKRENGKWMLSDEGHTYMHLTYDIDERDLQRGTQDRKSLLMRERLSKDLTSRFGRGFSVDILETMRLFYKAYPPERISETLSRKSGRDWVRGRTKLTA